MYYLKFWGNLMHMLGIFAGNRELVNTCKDNRIFEMLK
jgi:hypothetical protein